MRLSLLFSDYIRDYCYVRLILVGTNQYVDLPINILDDIE